MRDLLRDRVRDLDVQTVEGAGEGDYCWASVVDGEWIFLVAKHAEGSRSLERVAAIMPDLAPTLSLAVPDIRYAGPATGASPAFVGYRRIPGTELTTARFNALSSARREQVAADLATFLRQMHGFPVDAARRAGIVACDYPFCATEDGISTGTAAEQYRRDLDRLLAYPQLDPATRAYCERIVTSHLASLADPATRPIPPALLHNEVSQDHVLFDPATGRVTGIIDFNGMIVGDPVRDLLYLFEDYGDGFTRALLAHYLVADPERVLAQLRFLDEWLTALRLLWALDHDYAPGIERRLRELRAGEDACG